MSNLRITGFEGDLKIQHSLYLRDVLGLRLKEAKEVTDDVLAGRARELAVSPDRVAQHARALRILGARVDDMRTIRITGVSAGVQKVALTRYLVALGENLKVAKGIADDVLDEKARQIEVPEGRAEEHAAALRELGALVEVVERTGEVVGAAA